MDSTTHPPSTLDSNRPTLGEPLRRVPVQRPHLLPYTQCPSASGCSDCVHALPRNDLEGQRQDVVERRPWLWWGGPGTGGVDGDAASVPDVHALPGPSALGPITGAASGAIEHLVSRDEAQASSSTEVWSLPSAHFALVPFAPDPQLDRMPRTAAAISLFVATLRWSRSPSDVDDKASRHPQCFQTSLRALDNPLNGWKVLLRCSRQTHLHGPSLHRLILAAVKSACPRNGDRSQR